MLRYNIAVASVEVSVPSCHFCSLWAAALLPALRPFSLVALPDPLSPGTGPSSGRCLARPRQRPSLDDREGDLAEVTVGIATRQWGGDHRVPERLGRPEEPCRP